MQGSETNFFNPSCTTFACWSHFVQKIFFSNSRKSPIKTLTKNFYKFFENFNYCWRRKQFCLTRIFFLQYTKHFILFRYCLWYFITRIIFIMCYSFAINNRSHVCKSNTIKNEKVFTIMRYLNFFNASYFYF